MAGLGEGAHRLDDDAPGPTVANSDLMRSLPETVERSFKVPKVLGEGEGA
jgi:Asp-tRNA(Asn)/Glu-tRNA(Gln) amidotransferase C subunit